MISIYKDKQPDTSATTIERNLIEISDSSSPTSENGSRCFWKKRDNKHSDIVFTVN